MGAFPLQSLRVQCLVFQIAQDQSLEESIRQLAADPLVESVQENQSFNSLASAHDDPYARIQQGANAVHAALAHLVATGKGVRVAVVDTGIAVDHPDLRDRIMETENFVEGGKASFNQDRHGTAVAGVIAASADNHIGIFGIAPEAKLLALKACQQRSEGSEKAECSSWSLARAVDYAIRSDAQVINLSLTGPRDALLERLIAKAVDDGIVVVAAVRNDAQGPGFPASMQSVIAVLDSDAQGQVQVAVKASSITMLAAPGEEILSTAPVDSYDFFSGSSLAAAHVSGVSALVLELFPSLSPAELRALLRSTARPAHLANDDTRATSIGVIDACAALQKMLNLEFCS